MKLSKTQNENIFKPLDITLTIGSKDDASRLYALFNNADMINFLNVSREDAVCIRRHITDGSGTDIGASSYEAYNILKYMLGGE